MKYIFLLIIPLILVSCDHFSFGEGIFNYGISKKKFDGHTYIIYRTEEGCAILHDKDCIKCQVQKNDSL